MRSQQSISRSACLEAEESPRDLAAMTALSDSRLTLYTLPNPPDPSVPSISYDSLSFSRVERTVPENVSAVRMRRFGISLLDAVVTVAADGAIVSWPLLLQLPITTRRKRGRVSRCANFMTVSVLTSTVPNLVNSYSVAKGEKWKW